MLGWDPLHVIQIPPTLSYHLEHSCHHSYPHSHYIADACYKPVSTEGPLTEPDGTCALGNLMKILFTAGIFALSGQYSSAQVKISRERRGLCVPKPVYQWMRNLDLEPAFQSPPTQHELDEGANGNNRRMLRRVWALFEVAKSFNP